MIRKSNEADLPLIFDSWIKSFRGAPAVAKMANDLYSKEMRRNIGAFLTKEAGAIRILCSDDMNADNVQAWCAVETVPDYIKHLVPGDWVLHYCYVRPTFRRLGLAKALLDGLRIGAYSHFSLSLVPLIRKIAPQAKYDPFLFSTDLDWAVLD